MSAIWRAAVATTSAGRLPAGSMVKLYFATDRGYLGAPFGLPPTATALDAYLEILADCDVPRAVSMVGGDVVASEIAWLALARGGHLHLGLEFYAGDRQPMNVELVTEAVLLCEKAGRPIATADQAATILGLPRPRPDHSRMGFAESLQAPEEATSRAEVGPRSGTKIDPGSRIIGRRSSWAGCRGVRLMVGRSGCTRQPKTCRLTSAVVAASRSQPGVVFRVGVVAAGLREAATAEVADGE
jgi:hypothetical protein